MEQGRRPFLGLWRNPIGTVVLYGSLATHLGLAFLSIYRRRSLRMPAWEATQLIVGLLIPPLLAIHIIGTRRPAVAQQQRGDTPKADVPQRTA